MTAPEYPLPESDTSHRVGVLGWSPQSNGVHHHRIGEPLRVLADHGITAIHSQILSSDLLAQVDTVVAQMLHTEDASQAWQQLANRDNHRLVLDVDDAMWAPDWRPLKDHYTPEVLGRLYRNVQLAHVVTTPSPAIAEYLSAINPNVWIVPNTLPAWVLEHKQPDRDYRAIGWQGSTSHVNDWRQSDLKHLWKFLRDYPDWHLHLYGGIEPGVFAMFGDRVHFTRWIASVPDYYRAVSFDIGIGPLRDTYFNRCKSDLRAREYAALGVVAALPSKPNIYRNTVVNRVTGRLIESHETLGGVLRDLAENADLDRMASAARDHAETFTTEANIENWTNAWHSQ